MNSPDATSSPPATTWTGMSALFALSLSETRRPNAACAHSWVQFQNLSRSSAATAEGAGAGAGGSRSGGGGEDGRGGREAIMTRTQGVEYES